MDLEELEKMSPFALGEENTGYAQYFDGKSYLNMLTLEQVPTAVVTFEPGCRNHWHIHHAAKGGGTDPHRHRRPGLLPGMGETCPGAESRRRCKISRRK